MRFDLGAAAYALNDIPPLLLYQLFASILVGYALINALADWFSLRRPRRPRLVDPEDTRPVPAERRLPSISVLIPARDEEATLQRCAGSLIAQEYPGDVEILILDDNSTDHTGFIAGALAAGNSRVRALTGGEMLPGWKGKPNALRQLAATAKGDLLLFTDADCVFQRGGLDAAVRFREEVKADCLSLMPYLECRTIWEQVIEPLQYFLIFVMLPIRSIYASRNPLFAAANGAFLLLPRALYEEIDGHEIVKGDLAEDFKFARHVKRLGYRMVYGDGSRIYTVRMYKSLRQIWDAFSRTAFPAMGKRPVVLLACTLYLSVTQLLPFVFVATAWFARDTSLGLFWIPAAHCAIAIGIRLALSVRFRQSIWAVPTHPIGWLIAIASAFNSAYLTYSGKGHTWKGRVYQT